MKLNEIQELIRFVAKSGAVEVELETKEIKIKIRTSPKGKTNGYSSESPILAPVISSPISAVNPIMQTPVVIPTATHVAETTTTEKVVFPEKKVDSVSYTTIKSPMIGTFYRSPEPGKPAFIGVGDEIRQGKVICIIEAMKLFNEIEAEVSGRIVKVLVEDATPVEYDQPLFLVEPV
jgi:acetyl-CoA carboxylase biotin carboxyl carrier protein